MTKSICRAAMACCLLYHGTHAFFYLGGPDLWRSRLPILVHDHPYVAYNGKIAAMGLRESGTTAAYDPRYMAGYINSFISSSNGVLPFFNLLAGSENDGYAYKAYAIFAIAAMPILIAGAARCFGWTPGEATASAILWTLIFWGSGKLWRYVDYGMIAFVTSSGWLLLACGVMARYFELPSTRRAFLLGVITGIACLWHTTAGILLVPAAFVMAAMNLRTRVKGLWSGLSLALALCIAINWSWLATIPSVWGTLGETPKFFVNPNVIERVVDIFRLKDESVSAPLILSIAGTSMLRRRMSFAGMMILATTAALLAFLSYPAGWFRSLDVLQPGRNTVGLTALLCLPAGGIIGALRVRGNRWIACVSLAAAAWYLSTTIPGAGRNFLNVANSAAYRLPSRLPGFYLQMASEMKRTFAGFRRVFYEDCNWGYPDAPNPFFTFRPSPLMAELTGLELVGGPYLRTHYNTGSVQAGDGKLFGRSSWTISDFQRWANAYDVHGIVCWSPAMTRFCLSHPELFKQEFDWFERSSGGTVYGFSLRDGGSHLRGSSVVAKAEVNRIRLECEGTFEKPAILPYHWQPGLRTSGSTAIRPAVVEGAALPMIEVVRLDSAAEIRYDALNGWKWLTIR